MPWICCGEFFEGVARGVFVEDCQRVECALQERPALGGMLCVRFARWRGGDRCFGWRLLGRGAVDTPETYQTGEDANIMLIETGHRDLNTSEITKRSRFISCESKARKPNRQPASA